MKKRVLILSNEHNSTYGFRKELIESLLNNYEVGLALPYGEKVEKFKEMGCLFFNVKLKSKGKNPFQDLRYYLDLISVIKHFKPDLILSFTIKPNLYGGFASKTKHVQFIPNITGLGNAVGKKSILSKVITFLYKRAFKKAGCVMFQNQNNLDFFKKNKIVSGNYCLLPGSGVNLEEFKVTEYPKNDRIVFNFISRVLKEKGIDEYLGAAQFYKSKSQNHIFRVIGSIEKKYVPIIKKFSMDGVIEYIGRVDNVSEYISKADCTIHPTYYPEGISNTILETSACGRPFITTNRPGTKEILIDGFNGFLCVEKDLNSLTKAIDKFLGLPFEVRRQMGLNARKIVENGFDKKIVINLYSDKIRELLNSAREY